jgi:hypothetical protein
VAGRIDMISAKRSLYSSWIGSPNRGKCKYRMVYTVAREPVYAVHLCALMTMTVDVLRSHLSYTAWASRRLVDAATALSRKRVV